ncbi:hypothetical protein BO83DRAFT_442467 [Aspergillus eucalypticola CBS 122712]|uniref:Uncharacterized protein n=1 Tax=Aspergillus eucalypticola (strain CBS 122712 / IBT 29274) TaxID=1448314 RepID=A0A317UIQ8_ASPEC|nr:uncharacterized protein BO83DRAFT_442467 [Aspergillus eucalypticola CBS 122712]PWY61561.1 hypothetical protein BO83DRAFT_442467 [Aspergillus eucalypticola CBS 122712]
MSLGQLVSSNAHTKWAGRPTTRTPQSAAIHGHPGRLAASPSARAPYPPSRPVSPRGASHHPISPGQLVNSLRQHARNSPRAPDACLPGPRRERRPVSRPRPTGAPAPCGRPSCVQTFCGPKVIRGDAHRPTASWRPSRAANWSTALGRAQGPGRPPCLDAVRAKSTRFDSRSIPSFLGEVEWPTGV